MTSNSLSIDNRKMHFILSPEDTQKGISLITRMGSLIYLFEKIPNNHPEYQSLLRALEILETDILNFLKLKDRSSTLMSSITDRVQGGLLIQESVGVRQKQVSGSRITFGSLDERINRLFARIDGASQLVPIKAPLRAIDAAQYRTQQVDSVLLASPIQPLQSLLDDIDRYSSIDKRSKKQYLTQLQSIIAGTQNQGQDQEEVVRLEGKIREIIEQKSMHVASENFPRVSSHESPALAIENTSEVKEVDAEYNHEVANYLQSLITSLGSITASAVSSNSIGDGPFRRSILSPILRQAIYLLQNGKIDARNFSWNEVVNTDFEVKGSGLPVFVRLCRQSVELGGIDKNIAELSLIVDRAQAALKINCTELVEGISGFLESNPLPELAI